MTLSRRSLITGLASFLAAPAIVRASSIMPVKAWAEPIFSVGQWEGITWIDEIYDAALAARMESGLIPWGATTFVRNSTTINEAVVRGIDALFEVSGR